MGLVPTMDIRKQTDSQHYSSFFIVSASLAPSQPVLYYHGSMTGERRLARRGGVFSFLFLFFHPPHFSLSPYCTTSRAPSGDPLLDSTCTFPVWSPSFGKCNKYCGTRCSSRSSTYEQKRTWVTVGRAMVKGPPNLASFRVPASRPALFSDALLSYSSIVDRPHWGLCPISGLNAMYSKLRSKSCVHTYILHMYAVCILCMYVA